MPLTGLPGAALFNQQNLNMQTTTEKLIYLHKSVIRNLDNRRSAENMTPSPTKDLMLTELDGQYYAAMKEINSLAPQPSINQQIDNNGGPY